MAAHAWKFAGRVISANAESAVVQLEWQRVMNEGATVTEAATSVQLTASRLATVFCSTKYEHRRPSVAL